jgi:hypothetical protein
MDSFLGEDLQISDVQQYALPDYDILIRKE